jgi:HJR/Mrr/RecB family endonuclease
MGIELTPTPTEHGWVFSLTDRGLFGGSRSIPVTRWTVEASPRLLPGISALQAWVDEDVGSATTEQVTVPHAVIASIDGATAAALLLPATMPYVLDLAHEGTIEQAHFRFRTVWVEPNGQPVLGARREGSALLIGTKMYRIPDPLFSIVEASERFNKAPPSDSDGRFRAWAELQPLLPERTQRSVRVGDYLRNTRIAHASSFSLAFSSGGDGFRMQPILFGSIARETFQTASSDGVADEDQIELPNESEGLLPPQQQKIFAEERFPESDQCKGRYVLGDGWFVIIDEPVRQALSVVRAAQRQDIETRRAFAQNPRSFLAAALEGKVNAELFEALFVETSEYSKRISDIGLWQPKVLPWVKRSNDTWLPEQFAIQIGDQLITVAPADIADLRGQISQAIQLGQGSVEWKGIKVPATSQTSEALDTLISEIRPPNERPKDPKSRPLAEDDPNSAIVLRITDNLSDLGYSRANSGMRRTIEAREPVCVRTVLKPHQLEGLRWLQEAWLSGEPGVLLADDMGLGKTLQTLAFLAWVREAMDRRDVRRLPFLVVAPTGLLTNWQQEQLRHLRAPGLGEPLRVFGPDLARMRQRAGREIEIGESVLDSRQLHEAEWVLTTYETMRDYQHSFATVPFSVLVFDEMQKIKTPGTIMTHAAKALNADFLIGLTGTPIENRLADLWCLVDTLQPGQLGDLASFSRTYEKEDDLGKLKELRTMMTEPRASDGARKSAIDQPSKRPPLMMRRMKADRLKGLPEKFEHPLEALMPIEQAEAYDKAIIAARTGESRTGILEALHRMRSISLHPIHPQQAPNDADYVRQSARLALAIQALDEIFKDNEKVLVFLESREMQPYLACLIQRRYGLPTQPMIINGAVAGSKRQDRVDKFNSSDRGFDVMLLSPKAGGVGLNLTAANHVIHLSRWWNPAVEDQCTDRVYRIGQNKPVHVYYVQAIHPTYGPQSFDRRLHSLLEKKRNLSREMLIPPVGPNDATELFEQTVGIKINRDMPINFETIDSMEPIEFEEWVLSRLRDVGHRVERTPRSHDCGADGIAHHRVTGEAIIIQCKHSQEAANAPDRAIDDLLRAREAYSLPAARLVAVTNARQFTRASSARARDHSIRLVSREELSKWPWLIDG